MNAATPPTQLAAESLLGERVAAGGVWPCGDATDRKTEKSPIGQGEAPQ
jgi:hypothetical protein